MRTRFQEVTVATDLQKTIVNEVTVRIRQEIISGRIQPGQRIRLRTLEELFGVSHIPIREALRSLEAEGLVHNIPQRGAIAAPLSIEELMEVYDLRRLLEPAVAERAIPNLTKEQLRMSAKALDELNAIPGQWTSPEFPEAHRRFHWLLLEPGATSQIERVVTQLWQISERYVRFSMIVGGGASIAKRQHTMLQKCAKAGDVARFRAELIAHLHNTESRVRDVIGNHALTHRE
jgi:DNA-binding GntR family transcriptional regulator